MRIELITCVEDLEGTWCYEFQPGEFRWEVWNSTSVYLDGDVFSLLEPLFWDRIPWFAPYGLTTISGNRIGHLAKGLGEFAKTVGRAESPDEIWDPSQGSRFVLEQIDDWRPARRQLGVALHDLKRWILAVKARSEPISILGL